MPCLVPVQCRVWLRRVACRIKHCAHRPSWFAAPRRSSPLPCRCPSVPRLTSLWSLAGVAVLPRDCERGTSHRSVSSMALPRMALDLHALAPHTTAAFCRLRGPTGRLLRLRSSFVWSATQACGKQVLRARACGNCAVLVCMHGCIHWLHCGVRAELWLCLWLCLHPRQSVLLRFGGLRRVHSWLLRVPLPWL